MVNFALRFFRLKLNIMMSLETAIETNETALDLEQPEAEKNQIAFDATREFLKSGIEIKDVFGNLEDRETCETV